MPSFDLDDNECGQLMAVLAHAEGKGITWSVINPLMMKIGGQLRAQTLAATRPLHGNSGVTSNVDSSEVNP